MDGQKNKNLISRGKRLAFLLRHDKNYQFDEHGWREISDLITSHGYTMDELKEIVETNNKQRYEFSEDMTRIRARQGHSVHVDVELEEKLPPDVLYHGTGEQSLVSIMEQGINKGNRLYVHLSETSETAVNVGKRHGKPVVLVIDAKRMAEDGHKFFLSRNGVWLTDYVDVKYLNGVLNMEDCFVTERNDHQLVDSYDSGTNTLDIRSNGVYPSNVLSNLCSNGFRFDGMVCGSMEGFLQSLKHQDRDKQRQICSMKGGNARKHSVTSWQTDQIVWWKGQAYDRQSEEYQKLIRRAYQAMFDQSERFRAALMQTRGITLIHSSGEESPYKTILTEQEFCQILTEMRDSYDRRDKGIERKKRVFVDMDNVLVDFESGLAQVSEEVKQEYEGRLDEIPGLFGLMKPMPGAIDAMHELQKRYDLFILSTAPWKNPSAWSDKVKWVTQYLDDVFHKRMVITHRKDLCQGDYLIDDRGKNGTSEFAGEWIEFGSEKFPDWNSVLRYLGVVKEC
jgi:RNA:NAD 2'-phosphotransferase (TPT1/KptA family)/5'(3')-deoxyribonucleotidase